MPLRGEKETRAWEGGRAIIMNDTQIFRTIPELKHWRITRLYAHFGGRRGGAARRNDHKNPYLEKEKEEGYDQGKTCREPRGEERG